MLPSRVIATVHSLGSTAKIQHVVACTNVLDSGASRRAFRAATHVQQSGRSFGLLVSLLG